MQTQTYTLTSMVKAHEKTISQNNNVLAKQKTRPETASQNEEEGKTPHRTNPQQAHKAGPRAKAKQGKDKQTGHMTKPTSRTGQPHKAHNHRHKKREQTVIRRTQARPEENASNSRETPGRKTHGEDNCVGTRVKQCAWGINVPISKHV